MSDSLTGTSAADWAATEAGLAAAKQTWWGTSASGAWKDSLDYTAAQNDKYTAYQQSLDTAYLNYVNGTQQFGSGAIITLPDGTQIFSSVHTVTPASPDQRPEQRQCGRPGNLHAGDRRRRSG